MRRSATRPARQGRPATGRGALAALLLATVLVAAGGPVERVRAEPGGKVRIVAVEGAFEDVAAYVADAIVNRGLVIDYRGYIGRMLKRTGADAGSAKPIYRDAQFFQFCSAVFSRRTMEADPRNIAYCPYVVFVYELAANPGTVHVGYRRPARAGSAESRKALAAVESLLDAIVLEATE